jgi:SagB-type dehydrogenase family enzyme
LICWSGGRLLFQILSSGESVLAAAETVLLLDAFDKPRSPNAAADALPGYERQSVLGSIRRLARLRLLLPEAEGRRRRSQLQVWKENLASAHYHAASRDVRFYKTPDAIDHFLERVATRARPAPFKRYPGAGRRRLRPPARFSLRAVALDEILRERRTVRDFSREPVAFEDLSAIVRGTWGRTGWLDGGVLGSLATKTSPSAGGLHPIECYLIVWNVRDLPSGLYHYDVAADEFRRLRTGDLRGAAVKAASGQAWVSRAGFLCVMTAVFARTLWKYQLENAYRVLWLDAGHLCQTFDLLATAHGLGPFQTAAIQDSYIEKLIGLDGVKEFPVYLCGAGVPAKKLL